MDTNCLRTAVQNLASGWVAAGEPPQPYKDLVLALDRMALAVLCRSRESQAIQWTMAVASLSRLVRMSW